MMVLSKSALILLIITCYLPNINPIDEDIPDAPISPLESFPNKRLLPRQVAYTPPNEISNPEEKEYSPVSRRSSHILLTFTYSSVRRCSIFLYYFTSATD